MTIHEKEFKYMNYKKNAMNQIEQMLDMATETVLQGKTFMLTFKTGPSSFSRLSCKRASMQQYLTVMAEVYRLLRSDTHTTKRDLYYRHKELFSYQSVVDKIVEHLSLTFEVPRDALSVHASAKGLVRGDLTIVTKTSLTDCRPDAVLIPRDDIILDVITDARMVIVIEKDAIFQNVAADYLWLKERLGPLLIVTGKGYPDLATLCLLRSLKSPKYVLVDYDPHGLEIFLHYNRTVPEAEHLGVTCEDVEKFSELTDKRLPLRPHDEHKLTRMLKRESLSVEIRQTLMRMRVQGWRAELEVLCEAPEPNFFTRHYLLSKLL